MTHRVTFHPRVVSPSPPDKPSPTASPPAAAPMQGRQVAPTPPSREKLEPLRKLSREWQASARALTGGTTKSVSAQLESGPVAEKVKEAVHSRPSMPTPPSTPASDSRAEKRSSSPSPVASPPLDKTAEQAKIEKSTPVPAPVVSPFPGKPANPLDLFSSKDFQETGPSLTVEEEEMMKRELSEMSTDSAKYGSEIQALSDEQAQRLEAQQAKGGTYSKLDRTKKEEKLVAVNQVYAKAKKEFTQAKKELAEAQKEFTQAYRFGPDGKETPSFLNAQEKVTRAEKKVIQAQSKMTKATQALPPDQRLLVKKWSVIEKFMAKLKNYKEKLEKASSKDRSSLSAEERSKQLDQLVDEKNLHQWLTHYTDNLAYYEQAKILASVGSSVNTVKSHFKSDDEVAPRMQRDIQTFHEQVHR